MNNPAVFKKINDLFNFLDELILHQYKSYFKSPLTFPKLRNKLEVVFIESMIKSPVIVPDHPDPSRGG